MSPSFFRASILTRVRPAGCLSSPESVLLLREDTLVTAALDVVRQGQRGPPVQQQLEDLVVVALGGGDERGYLRSEDSHPLVNPLPRLPATGSPGSGQVMEVIGLNYKTSVQMQVTVLYTVVYMDLKRSRFRSADTFVDVDRMLVYCSVLAKMYGLFALEQKVAVCGLTLIEQVGGN